jgi:hypothetical protein
MWSVFLVSILSFGQSLLWAGVPHSFSQNNIRYKTFIGECPQKSSASFAMLVMKEFEKNHSLKLVKEKILKEKLDEKHFLSDYRIGYNPVIKTVRVNLDCPQPLLKVQVYKSNGEEHYSAVMGDNAKLYDPGYENLMKAEKRLNHSLPLLAISTKQLEGEVPSRLAKFIAQMDKEHRSQISEIILSKTSDLTIVFAFSGRATSVFLGADLWEDKLVKLTKIIDYVHKNKKYPGSINLVNVKKVVVKFSDNI